MTRISSKKVVSRSSRAKREAVATLTTTSSSSVQPSVPSLPAGDQSLVPQGMRAISSVAAEALLGIPLGGDVEVVEEAARVQGDPSLLVAKRRIEPVTNLATSGK